jgi:glutamyl-tRNA reductase
MILGESQILGQVSQALLEAQAAGTTGAVLSQLFERAAHSGKRARTETAISRHSTSTSHAASRLIGEMTGGLNDAHVLIVGAGEMAEVAARALSDRGVGKLSFINRTYSRAEGLARKIPGQALNWSELQSGLIGVDAVLTATGAPHIVIHKSDVQQAIDERAGKPLFVVDIAVPRDVEVGVDELPGVRLFDIDDLKSVVDENIASRQAAVPQVEAIVQEEADRYQEWLSERGVVPVLVALRRKAKSIAQEEMKRNSEEFERLDPEGQERVSRMVHRIVNKLLHDPTVRLKAAAADGNGVEYADALRDLFALDTSGVSESKTPGPEHPDGNLTGRDQKYTVIEGTLTKEGQS